jgi:hypothetical protein
VQLVCRNIDSFDRKDRTSSDNIIAKTLPRDRNMFDENVEVKLKLLNVYCLLLHV